MRTGTGAGRGPSSASSCSAGAASTAFFAAFFRGRALAPAFRQRGSPVEVTDTADVGLWMFVGYNQASMHPPGKVTINVEQHFQLW